MLQQVPAENHTGKGRVYKQNELIAEVIYELQVFRDKNSPENVSNVVTGKLKPVDKKRVLWGFEQYTLYLQDSRKLDFLCVNYDPDCEIVSDKGFYA